MVSTNACKKLSKGELVELAARYRDGDTQAGWTMVEALAGFICTCAKKHAPQFRVSIDEMKSELTMLVFDELRTFDPRRSALTSFASMVIARRVTRVLKRYSQNTIGQAVRSQDEREIDAVLSSCRADELDELLEDVREASVEAGLSPVEIDSLCMWANDVPDNVAEKRLRKRYPNMIAPRRFNIALNAQSIDRMRELLGVEPPSLENASRAEIIAKARTLMKCHPTWSTKTICAELVARGADLTYSTLERWLGPVAILG